VQAISLNVAVKKKAMPNLETKAESSAWGHKAHAQVMVRSRWDEGKFTLSSWYAQGELKVSSCSVQGKPTVKDLVTVFILNVPDGTRMKLILFETHTKI
jgi:hypothetical protein